MADWVCSFGVRNCTVCRRNYRWTNSPADRKAKALEAYRCRIASDQRTWLNVPFSDKNRVKALGGMWCPDTKKWYAPRLDNLEVFRTWLVQPDAVPVTVSASTERTDLTTTYSDRFVVKNLGARWDADKRTWYVPAGIDTTPFARWMPASVAPTVESEIVADVSFADLIGRNLRSDRNVGGIRFAADKEEEVEIPAPMESRFSCA